MAQNRSKPAETGNPRVYALEVTREWMDQEGGRQRIPSALRQLLESTYTAVARGESPPEKDSSTLTELWRLSRDGSEAASATPLKGSEVSRWWSAREARVRQLCADHGCQWVPQLVVRTGGGRNLQTQFSFSLEPLDPPLVENPEESSVETAGLVRYRIDPAKPALWIRLLVGSRPFPINSWRGYVLLGSTMANLLFVGFIWLVTYLSWSQGRSLTTADLAHVAMAIVLTFGTWSLTRPVRLLPTERVTLAGVGFLAMAELHGQLRTMRDETSAGASRVFSIVRHWGLCPVCAAEVDLDVGGAAFPDRLIGRCHDAPLEHVFSFDPVRLVGEPLRPTGHDSGCRLR